MYGTTKQQTMLGGDHRSTSTSVIVIMAAVGVGMAAGALLASRSRRSPRKQWSSDPDEPLGMDEPVQAPQMPAPSVETQPIIATVGQQASDILAGDLPGSVGGLSAGVSSERNERNL